MSVGKQGWKMGRKYCPLVCWGFDGLLRDGKICLASKVGLGHGVGEVWVGVRGDGLRFGSVGSWFEASGETSGVYELVGLSLS